MRSSTKWHQCTVRFHPTFCDVSRPSQFYRLTKVARYPSRPSSSAPDGDPREANRGTISWKLRLLSPSPVDAQRSRTKGTHSPGPEPKAPDPSAATPTSPPHSETPHDTSMSDLQRAWARSKLGLQNDMFNELEEEQETDLVPELPEGVDDDSSSASSASSVSSTGTVIPSPNQKLFARPQG